MKQWIYYWSSKNRYLDTENNNQIVLRVKEIPHYCKIQFIYVVVD